MNLVYTSSTDDFQPISFGDSYLYDNYGRLSSFLKNRLSITELNRLAQPMLSANKKIEWFSVFNAPMEAIIDFPEETQVAIEKEYLELIRKIERTIVEFRNSQDNDKGQWAAILKLVFNPSDNKLLFNGQDWIFIWGWQFRNKLIIQNPNFSVSEQIEPELEQPIDSSIDDFISFSEEDLKQANESYENPDLEYKKPIIEIIPPVIKDVPFMRKRVSFWERIKRFFRWITYRFWGLMLLIIFVLLILCLCKKCCQQKPEDCSVYENIDKELHIIEERLKERCPKSNDDAIPSSFLGR